MRIFRWYGSGCYDYMAVCDENEFNVIINRYQLDAAKYAAVSKFGDHYSILLNSKDRIFSFPPFLSFIHGGQYGDELPYSANEYTIDNFDFNQYTYKEYPFLEPQDKIDMLHTTLAYCHSKLPIEEYKKATVYLPDEVKKMSEGTCEKGVITVGKRCGYSVLNADSFTVARMLSEQPKFPKKDNGKNEVLVLNFANPVNPGGGVRRGALAQEEDLCRKSSLLLSLESQEAKRYYDYNKSLYTHLGSDAIIISPKVAIVKDENGKLLDHSATVAVMTCAAPYIRNGLEGLSQEEYETLLYNRIVCMLKVAAYLKYKVLVLGAWGCGAFCNDAALVSDLFYKALKELQFNGMRENLLFDRIDFAVLSRSKSQYNYHQFKRNFEHFYREEDEAQDKKVLERIKKSEVNLDKIRGCLLGGAIGDALGYPVEFFKEEDIFAEYGKDGITAYNLDERTGKALISDDTQMTLFTANGILVRDTREAMRGVSHNPRNFVARAYLDWLFTQGNTYQNRNKIKDRQSWLLDVPELYHRRAPGNTCLSALYQMKEKKQLPYNYLTEKFNNSKGCGGVMRVAPLGLSPYSSTPFEAIDEEAAQLAAITHSHSLGYLPAAVLVHIVRKAVYFRENLSLREII